MATILKGDCLEIMKTLKDKSIDCFICDLPYGCLTATGKKKNIGETAMSKGCFGGRTLVRYENGKATKNTAVYSTGGVISGCDWDVKIDLEKFWEQIKRLSKNEHTPVLMFCNTKFGVELINSNPSWFRYDLVWSKTNAVGFLCANIRPMTSHEMIYVFSKKGANYKRINYIGDFPAGGGGTSTANFLPIAGMPNLGTTKAGERCPTTVITIPNKKCKGGHPTAKPEELYEWLISRYCPEGGTVLDPTAGSFNSIAVAKKLGFKAIGIEKDINFFWKAVKRFTY
jgi:site-specific DNA-methyltransferase (adenine-specific)